MVVELAAGQDDVEDVVPVGLLDQLEAILDERHLLHAREVAGGINRTFSQYHFPFIVKAPQRRVWEPEL